MRGRVRKWKIIQKMHMSKCAGKWSRTLNGNRSLQSTRLVCVDDKDMPWAKCWPRKISSNDVDSTMDSWQSGTDAGVEK